MRVLEQVERLTLLQELARLVLDVDESIGHAPNQLLRLFDGEFNAHDVYVAVLHEGPRCRRAEIHRRSIWYECAGTEGLLHQAHVGSGSGKG